VPAHVTVRAQGRHGELRYREDPVDQELLPAESGGLDRCERSIGTVARSSVGIVIAVRISPRAGNAERHAIIENPITGELPSSTRPAIPGAAAAQERNVPVTIEAKKLRHVKPRDAAAERTSVHV